MEACVVSVSPTDSRGGTYTGVTVGQTYGSTKYIVVGKHHACAARRQKHASNWHL